MKPRRPAAADPAAPSTGQPPLPAHEAGALLRRLEALDAAVYLDVSPLIERQWTGIPIVAAGLGAALQRLLPGRLHFFLGPRLLCPDTVSDALRRNTGRFLEREITSGRAYRGWLPLLAQGAGTERAIGIFPSVKPLRRAFGVECGVVHDLSTLVLPYFHIKGNVDHHMEAMLDDLASSDVVIAVSQATAGDLTAYLGVAPEKIVTVPNGVSWPEDFPLDAANALAPAGAEPYVLILGTREPRKNVLLVFDMLEAHPALLNAHRFVFAGKMGWLEEMHAMPKALEPAQALGRILFTGFVSDATKYRLLAGARATLYPSLFEGFGLPVLESLSAGTPVVASWSSSIPEVGGEACTYFDPLSPGDMARATQALLSLSQAEAASLSARCRAQAARFTWQGAAEAVLGAALPLLEERLRR